MDQVRLMRQRRMKKLEKTIDAIMDAAIDGDEAKLSQYEVQHLIKALIKVTAEAVQLNDKAQELDTKAQELDAKVQELERQLKGKYPGGRVPKYSDERKMQIAEFYLAGGQTYDSTADKFKVSKSTVRRALTLYRSRN